MLHFILLCSCCSSSCCYCCCCLLSLLYSSGVTINNTSSRHFFCHTRHEIVYLSNMQHLSDIHSNMCLHICMYVGVYGNIYVGMYGGRFEVATILVIQPPARQTIAGNDRATCSKHLFQDSVFCFQLLSLAFPSLVFH